MISLEAHLNTLDFTTQLETVRDLLIDRHATGVDKARASVTFWGSRVVTVDGFSGSVYLNDIARKLLRARGSFNEQTAPEIEAAHDVILGKLLTFYQLTDTDISNSNWFTRLLVWIREFSFCNPYTPRACLDL